MKGKPQNNRGKQYNAGDLMQRRCNIRAGNFKKIKIVKNGEKKDQGKGSVQVILRQKKGAQRAEAFLVGVNNLRIC
jgi:hypothetical protein